MKTKLYILLLLGLLSVVLSSPTCYADTRSELYQEQCVCFEHQTDAFDISQGSDVYAAQISTQVSIPQVVSERTVRTYSSRIVYSYSTALGKRLRHLTSFSNHSSWRIFPASTPFFCTTSKLFYVYALREIIR